MLRAYQAEGLDLAIAARRLLDAGATSWCDSAAAVHRAVLAAELAMAEEVERRARDHRRRTGTVRRPEEEELQALLVAALAGEPLRWAPGRRWGVVDLNHSPQGYLPADPQDLRRALAERAGCRTGWPDLDLRLVREGAPAGLLLELKAGSGRLSATQEERGARLRAAGFDVAHARGLWWSLLTVLGALGLTLGPLAALREERPAAPRAGEASPQLVAAWSASLGVALPAPVVASVDGW